MHKLTVVCPSSATSRITSAVAGRRGQMLGMAPRDGWTGWDRIDALDPRSRAWRASKPSCARKARAWRPTRPSSTISPSSTARSPTRSSSNGFPSRRKAGVIASDAKLVEGAHAGSLRRLAPRNDASLPKRDSMKHWFKDQHFRSLLKNSSYLAMSRGVAAVCWHRHPRLRRPRPRRGPVRDADPHHQLHQGGERDRQVPVVAADRPLRRPRRRRTAIPNISRSSTGFAFALDVLSGIAGMIVAVALLPFIAAWVGISRNICGWRCFTAPCCRRWARRRRAACCGRSTAST